MSIKNLLRTWKHPFLLLFGIGLSNIGDWIYLIALNLIVLDMTGSPLAVAILYILKPVAALFTNFWAGSLIDRINKRKLMIGLDGVRGVFLLLLPMFPSIWWMYGLVLLINVASSIFEPSSMTYITKLIPRNRRKRFNALRSMVDSGGFIIGPAIAGLFFMTGSPFTAIYVNALTFFVSGFISLFLPDLDRVSIGQATPEKMSAALLKRDRLAVLAFSRKHSFIMIIYFLFSVMMVLAAALDSLEAAFSKEVLSLSNPAYGLLVSVAGAGILVGSIASVFLAAKLRTRFFLGLGSLFVSAGYLIYAFSDNFAMASSGFFVLSFSLAFANTGFHTFYQENIPVDIMGRVTSLYGIAESVLVIITTCMFGIAANIFSIQLVVISGALLMLLLTVTLVYMYLYSPGRPSGVNV
ncbi:MFS transporter [Sediminibacillus massiliensis]|uniref:MFS transporter n=1 Tax=Sediminibacillus massiliensis TaxID=1926277 RepID=UPI001FEA4496|nr:MFS transporter [Sediminibacillus massiliensis]